MAEEETSSRITELKARLEADPESRVFYQLGEELRKAKRPDEAEAVLRKGLEKHPGYLSALISLGRVLKETSRSEEAIATLNSAFELDRQNVVVARLLGEAYSDTGEHVEAIKKYKLVAALHPADEEIQERIQQLEQTISMEGQFEETSLPPPPPGPPSASPAPETFEGQSEREGSNGETEQPRDVEMTPEYSEESLGDVASSEQFAPGTPEEEAGEGMVGYETGGEPDGRAENERPWSEREETTRSLAGAQDDGLFVRADSTTSGVEGQPTGWDSEHGAPAEPVEESVETGESDDVVATVTMADLYARQGHVEQARAIYRQILDREPDHQEAQDRLESLSEDEEEGDESRPAGDDSNRAKVRRLEDWLTKVRG